MGRGNTGRKEYKEEEEEENRRILVSEKIHTSKYTTTLTQIYVIYMECNTRYNAHTTTTRKPRVGTQLKAQHKATQHSHSRGVFPYSLIQHTHIWKDRKKLIGSL